MGRHAHVGLWLRWPEGFYASGGQLPGESLPGFGFGAWGEQDVIACPCVVWNRMAGHTECDLGDPKEGACVAMMVYPLFPPLPLSGPKEGACVAAVWHPLRSMLLSVTGAGRVLCWVRGGWVCVGLGEGGGCKGETGSYMVLCPSKIMTDPRLSCTSHSPPLPPHQARVYVDNCPFPHRPASQLSPLLSLLPTRPACTLRIGAPSPPTSRSWRRTWSTRRRRTSLTGTRR